MIVASEQRHSYLSSPAEKLGSENVEHNDGWETNLPGNVCNAKYSMQGGFFTIEQRKCWMENKSPWECLQR
jgi:hypothetical protein